MRMRGKYAIFLIALMLGLYSCNDSVTVLDTNKQLVRRNWSYTERPQFPVSIQDTAGRYNLYINLRHTPAYKYSNIFILVHTIGPDRKRVSQRVELRLALPDGEWLGKGSGDLYSYQIPFKRDYKFRQPGDYVFQLEQNMRDNPLEGITDVGFRIEKSN